ncbi:AMP-dependent synthetase and ligase [Methylobacterium sp. 4-46]|uniref:AMP-binding protein n=1 Tax=unclassified Methylobacterium TaxID=2615210 RepID=UPI000165CA76|nr:MULTISPECIES: AMP-binding protein [Methylobacterium]ACA18228.1 AMP-dependent synthetase and ligase [Methylobacterium sp. 4-46]WFT77525.1 AMP-binding protein [Methylobacterium nodulans]
MTKRADILNQPVPSVTERRRTIEAEPLPANIAVLLEEAADAARDRLAWNFFESGEQATYGEVRERVGALARGLLARGVRKGVHVGVMLPNIAAFPLSWLAIGTIGAVMVPINVTYRERELAYVLNDSEAEFLILHETARDVYERARAGGSIALPAERVLLVDGAAGPYTAFRDAFEPGSEPFTAPEPVGHADLLNIQYTSGTTGFPKGCLLTQEYWIIAGKVNARRDGRAYERILASTPFFYMDPQWLLLMTLYQRGTLFVAERQSATRFMGWVREHAINFCLLPLLVFKQPPHPDDRRNAVVRANMYGVPRDLHAAVEERFDLFAREAFGMTELGPTMFMPIEAVDKVGSGSCGVPGPFRECRVVDEQGDTVPAGAFGELVVRGRGIFKGYYNRPEATADAFFGEWFRTGDVFQRDRDGYFSILGRTKDMIRRSSENIAAREVEAVLQGAREVVEAAVVPVPDEVRGEEIKAYLVLEPGSAGDEAALASIIAHCRANLAPFKVPRFYEFRPDLPKTASNKIAKHRLTAELPDLRLGSYDRVAGAWLKAS